MNSTRQCKSLFKAAMLFVLICFSTLVQCEKIRHGFFKIVKINMFREGEVEVGKYVEAMRESGKCSSGVEVEINKFVEKKNEVTKATDDVIGEIAKLNEEEQAFFEEQKSILMSPERTVFLDLFYRYALLLEPIAKESLGRDHTNIENSILLNFLKVEKSEVDTYFEVKIKDLDDLLNVARDIKRICVDLLDSLLKDKDDPATSRQYLVAWKKHQQKTLRQASDSAKATPDTQGEREENKA